MAYSSIVVKIILFLFAKKSLFLGFVYYAFRNKVKYLVGIYKTNVYKYVMTTTSSDSLLFLSKIRRHAHVLLPVSSVLICLKKRLLVDTHYFNSYNYELGS